MNKKIEEENLGRNKRSLLYSKQKNFINKPQISSSPVPQRHAKSPLDLKSQTMRFFPKANQISKDLLQDDLKSLTFHNTALVKQNEDLLVKISSLTCSLENLKSQNQELIHTLIDVLESVIVSFGNFNSLKQKILLEIKTTLVKKLEDFCAVDTKQHIEKVTLWGNFNYNESKERAMPIITEELHPRNPFKEILRTEKALTLFNFAGEEEGDISFSKGETIEIIEKSDNGWWVGKLSGKTGTFPCNFVEILENS